jgi:hypothetical protein
MRWFDKNVISESCRKLDTFKGIVSRDFLLQGFFSWIIFPQAPESNTRVISNFFNNTAIADVVDTGGKLLPVSTTPNVKKNL